MQALFSVFFKNSEKAVILSEQSESKDLRTQCLLGSIEGAQIPRLHFVPLGMTAYYVSSSSQNRSFSVSPRTRQMPTHSLMVGL